jgi:hypothetical protein
LCSARAYIGKRDYASLFCMHLIVLAVVVGYLYLIVAKTATLAPIDLKKAGISPKRLLPYQIFVTELTYVH